jgi:hypothetical protein
VTDSEFIAHLPLAAPARHPIIANSQPDFLL